MLHDFQHPIDKNKLPERFNNPFDYTPHPLCIEAAKEVQSFLDRMDFGKLQAEEGKMFGVLIVRTPEEQIRYLAAFSGIFNGSYTHPYFVPPIYNLQQPDSFFPEEETYISTLNRKIRQYENAPDYITIQKQLEKYTQEAEIALNTARKNLKKAKMEREQQRQQTNYDADVLIRESQHQKAEYKRLQKHWKEKIASVQEQLQERTQRIEHLKTERKQRSAQLQQQLFELFRLRNALGEIKNVYDIFQAEGLANPPAGTGECAAPKLLQYAYEHQLLPLAIAEFWWGPSSKTEIRQPGNYYPACQGKCGPTLRFMLQGLELLSDCDKKHTPFCFPEIVYEDEWLLVVNKPSGMLSVPGKTAQPSVFDFVRQRYPEATGPLIVHRLDMPTSGLLVIAKEKKIHTHLQHQFLQRNIRKRYIALLKGEIYQEQGEIRLPLCPNIQDRPRQMVNEKWGKPAITLYRVIERIPSYTRIAFYPQTGRTHQLRVHAAHPLGLNSPIVGDSLYGQTAERLYLHAESIEFIHPATGEKIYLEKKADF